MLDPWTTSPSTIVLYKNNSPDSSTIVSSQSMSLRPVFHEVGTTGLNETDPQRGLSKVDRHGAVELNFTRHSTAASSPAPLTVLAPPREWARFSSGTVAPTSFWRRVRRALEISKRMVDVEQACREGVRVHDGALVLRSVEPAPLRLTRIAGSEARSVYLPVVGVHKLCNTPAGAHSRLRQHTRVLPQRERSEDAP